MEMKNSKPARSQKLQNNFLIFFTLIFFKIKDISFKYLDHIWPNSFEVYF